MAKTETPVPAKVQAEMEKGLRQRYAVSSSELPKGGKK